MKSQKRILVTLVACLLCMTTILPWASAEIIFYPQSSQLISSANAVPYAQGGGAIYTVASINCIGSADSLGFIYIRLQELRDGSWVTVKSVTSKYTSNASAYTYTFTYNGTPGMSYRALGGYSATDNGMNENRSSTSASIVCE